MTTPIAAANAYSALARLHDPTSTAKSALGAPEASGFGSMLKNALNSLNQTARQSDAQTQAMASGKANIVDVVTAVAETEVAIDTLVSVRDRVIQSYEEIMRMPI
jgi:flagellar hook-basal body complex protein FliE